MNLKVSYLFMNSLLKSWTTVQNMGKGNCKSITMVKKIFIIFIEFICCPTKKKKCFTESVP